MYMEWIEKLTIMMSPSLLMPPSLQNIFIKKIIQKYITSVQKLKLQDISIQENLLLPSSNKNQVKIALIKQNT